MHNLFLTMQRIWRGAVHGVCTGCQRYPRTLSTVFVVSLIAITTFYAFVEKPPETFPIQSAVSVPAGASLGEIAHSLEEGNVIRSATWFKTVAILSGNQRDIHAGEYYFANALGTIGVVRAITSGSYGIESLQITVPEGASVSGIASIIGKQLPDFDTGEFKEQARSHEGYLFPDTYRIMPSADPEWVIEQMRDNFNTRIEPLRDDIASSTHSLQEVVTMASILEREAQTTRDKRIIAGMLWKRLAIGMPLQVDAAFSYVNGKSTFDLTYEDLEDPSPYNTYRYRGLPPGPIANPGLESIRAALDPIDTNYLYYLSDMEGTMHYSETLDAHQQKKARYLQ